MKPPKQNKTQFERIPKYDEWIEGKILDVEYDPNHESVYQGEKKIRPCVRLKFGLKGCDFPHRSKWMTFNYGEKSNLYKQFISVLVDNAKPDMDFDLDDLKGMDIKTMWTESGDYDNLTMVRPLNQKVKSNSTQTSVEEVPF